MPQIQLHHQDHSHPDNQSLGFSTLPESGLSQSATLGEPRLPWKDAAEARERLACCLVCSHWTESSFSVSPY